MKKKPTSWGLFSRNGAFIAAFRFRPKRVYIPPFEGDGDDGRGYYAWTDCNGPRYYGSLGPKHPVNIIEGSMNAKCLPISTPAPRKET